MLKELDEIVSEVLAEAENNPQLIVEAELLIDLMRKVASIEKKNLKTSIPKK